jgi:hypothetical protein
MYSDGNSEQQLVRGLKRRIRDMRAWLNRFRIVLSFALCVGFLLDSRADDKPGPSFAGRSTREWVALLDTEEGNLRNMGVPWAAMTVDAVPVLREVIATQGWRAQVAVVCVVRRRGPSEKTLDVLAMCLRSKEPATRDAALAVTSTFGDQATPLIPALLQILGEGKQIRSVMHCTGDRGTVTASGIVFERLETRKEVDFRESIVDVFGEMGRHATDALPLLRRLREDKDLDGHLQQHVEKAIRQIGVEVKAEANSAVQDK